VEHGSARRRALEDVPAEEEWELEEGGRKIIFRQVVPPEAAAEADTDTAASEQRFAEAEIRNWRPDRPEPVHVGFHATVYRESGRVIGSEVSLWHEGAKHRFWTNLDFRLLRVVGSFERGNRHYSYFGFVEKVARSTEAERSRRAADFGARYESRWTTPPVTFAADATEYVWIGGAEGVPGATVRAAEDLLAHMAENRGALETARRNAARLGEARRKQREANPPQPEDTVINFYPLSERKDAQ